MEINQGLILSSLAPVTGELNLVATATQFPNVPSNYALIKAKSTNAGLVFIGRTGVTVPNGTTSTTAGYPLAAGQEMIAPVRNLNQLFGIAATAGDNVSYIVYS